MTINQFSELLTYVKLNNDWGFNMYTNNIERNRKSIKYVIGHFDSRDGSIYCVEFKDITNEQDKTFVSETEEHIDIIYKWLDKPLKVDEKCK